ncbi:MAG: ABC transporter ATP-binding protein, partial [Spirochaetes bacterium]|nr:ABC transporter ATP-binding protein [Spirochaetota bacterium]
MTSIRLENISKSFPGVKALENVNLTVEPGEFFTLLGPSGCGKTTLLRTIAGFYQQDAGHVHLGEQCIDSVPPHRRDTGMVFQNYAVFPHMTVFQNVAFGLGNRGIRGEQARERVAKALAMARLSGYEKRTPDQLSGGQQQRVGLARAMVIEPRVLLMDEPLSNLDAKLRIEMRAEIRDIQRQLGTTTVYVTHDQEEALVISDRIAVMKAGIVHQIGKPWEIYKNPRNTFVAAFVGNTNFIDGGLLGRAGVQLAVRPEDLSLAADGSATGGASGGASPAVIPGVVQKSTFTGSLVTYTVSCGGGVTLAVERHRPAPSDILSA